MVSHSSTTPFCSMKIKISASMPRRKGSRRVALGWDEEKEELVAAVGRFTERNERNKSLDLEGSEKDLQT